MAAEQRGAFREAPDVFFVLFKGCLFKEKLFRRCQNEEIHDSIFFFPSTKGFVGSKGEIAAYMLILFFAVKVGR